MNFELELTNSIKQINTKNPALLRNVVKEILQNFTLNYIYNSSYNNLIFTGGTCLRKVYGLNRLSEDLDFDYNNEFDIKSFANDIEVYYRNSLKLAITTKIAPNNRTVFIKIPIDQYKNVLQDKITSDILFLRCDFSEDTIGEYNLETNPITVGSFTFFVKSYDISTLFANKIAAFLKRNFYKGKAQEVPFKGRDIYDLFWLINLSVKSGLKIKPNIKRLLKLTGKDNLKELAVEIKGKLELVNPDFVYEDLYPLVESESFLKEFIKNYKSYITQKIDLIFN